MAEGMTSLPFFEKGLRLLFAAILCIDRKKAQDKVAQEAPFLENRIEKTENILYNGKRRDCLK